MCEALSLSSCTADKGPCPAGSRWPVTHLSHLMGTGLGGQAVWGSPLQCPGIWKWAVRGAWACFPHAVDFGGRPREGLACELQGGHRKGCGLRGPVRPPALSVPKAIRRELAEARQPLPDTCSHAGPGWRRACPFGHRPRRLISCCFLTSSHVCPEPPWPVTQTLSPGQGFTLENDRGGEMHTNIHRIYYF